MAKPNAAKPSAVQRAEAERLAAEKKRRERIRAWIFLGLIAALVTGLVVISVVPYLQNRAAEQRLADLKLSDIGASPHAAGCQPLRTEKVVVPQEGWHVPNGTALTYDAAPPAYGKHWAVPLREEAYRTFFTAADRPAKELLVHSLEHGHTVIWYDATLASDASQLALVKQLADRFQLTDGIVFAPWTSKDGAAFPGGGHLAMTHWTGGDPQQGVWQYCSGVSGAAVKAFVTAYSRTDAPEGGAV